MVLALNTCFWSAQLEMSHCLIKGTRYCYHKHCRRCPDSLSKISVATNTAILCPEVSLSLSGGILLTDVETQSWTPVKLHHHPLQHQI